jgi:hypothetical protein
MIRRDSFTNRSQRYWQRKHQKKPFRLRRLKVPVVVDLAVAEVVADAVATVEAEEAEAEAEVVQHPTPLARQVSGDVADSAYPKTRVESFRQTYLLWISRHRIAGQEETPNIRTPYARTSCASQQH